MQRRVRWAFWLQHTGDVGFACCCRETPPPADSTYIWCSLSSSRLTLWVLCCSHFLHTESHSCNTKSAGHYTLFFSHRFLYRSVLTQGVFLWNWKGTEKGRCKNADSLVSIRTGCMFGEASYNTSFFTWLRLVKPLGGCQAIPSRSCWSAGGESRAVHNGPTDPVESITAEPHHADSGVEVNLHLYWPASSFKKTLVPQNL